MNEEDKLQIDYLWESGRVTDLHTEVQFYVIELREAFFRLRVLAKSRLTGAFKLVVRGGWGV